MSIEWASGTRGESYPELSRGTTQSGVRLYNERLILSLVRLHGQLPKAEMARLTGLSAQTVSVIVRQLEADGLLRRRVCAFRQLFQKHQLRSCCLSVADHFLGL